MIETLIGIVFIALASLIALLNLMGWYRASQRARKGIPGGYSAVPLFSAMFSLFAFACAHDSIGYWAFLPAALDPGTWTIIVLPFYLVWCVVRGR